MQYQKRRQRLRRRWRLEQSGQWRQRRRHHLRAHLQQAPHPHLDDEEYGGVTGFAFTGGNGWASHTITTATPGTGVAGAAQTLNAGATATRITQAIPAGHVFTAPSCTCLGSGTVTPNLATGDMLFDATSMAAGAVIACTVTDNKIPTVKFQVSTLGSFGGPFTFTTPVNLTSAPASITTAALATPTPASPIAINTTKLWSVVNLTETPVTGYIFTSVSCTDANSSVTENTGTFGSVASNVLTIAALKIVAGADLTCVLTNTKTPIFKLQLISLAGNATLTPSAQTNLASTPAAITTTVVNTPTPASPAAIKSRRLERLSQSPCLWPPTL